MQTSCWIISAGAKCDLEKNCFIPGSMHLCSSGNSKSEILLFVLLRMHFTRTEYEYEDKSPNGKEISGNMDFL